MFIGRKIIAAPETSHRIPPAEKKAFNRSPLHLSSYKQSKYFMHEHKKCGWGIKYDWNGDENLKQDGRDEAG